MKIYYSIVKTKSEYEIEHTVYNYNLQIITKKDLKVCKEMQRFRYDLHNIFSTLRKKV